MVERPTLGKKGIWSKVQTLLAVFAAVILVAGVTIPSAAEAAQATLTWAAPTTYPDGTSITNLTGYRLYTGSAPGSYQESVDVGNVTSYTLGSLLDGSTYYFAVTAYDSSGAQSGYSNEVSKTFPAPSTTYQITATSGSGGAITALNNSNVSTATNGTTTITTVSVSSGANQSFSISAAAGYHTVDVSVDGASVGPVTSYTFSNVTANHTIGATFAQNSFTITASAGSGGSISPAGTVAVNYGAGQSFVVSPATGYSIADVKVDGSSVGPVTSYSFSNVTANHTIAASFTANTTTTASYAVSASTTMGGSISPAGTTTVASGGSVTYSITPASGYAIAYVLIDGKSVGVVSSYTFSNVTANHTIKAGFYAFAVNSGGANFPASTGVLYLADTKYSGGSTASTSNSINGTVDDNLYQRWRYGNFSYSVPVQNGNYDVKLKFSENQKTAKNQRVFDVLINGQTVISSLDLYAVAGKNTAYDVIIPVSVSSGNITIKFVSKVSSAIVNGMLITAK